MNGLVVRQKRVLDGQHSWYNKARNQATYRPVAGGVSNFDGSIDEVRLYSSALSASEIAALYNMGR